MKKIKSILPLLLSLILGGAVGVLACLVGLPTLDNTAGPLSLLLLLIPLVAAYYLQIIVHEGGHLIAGLLCGYRFLSFRIGALALTRQPGGALTLGRYTIPGTGGQCLLAPPEGDAPVLLYNLGGGLLNLAVSALAGALVPFAPRWLALFLALTAGFGVLMALTNLIPMRIGTVDNDGRNALFLSRDPATRRAFLQQMSMMGRLCDGQTLGQMPDALFQLPAGADRTAALTMAVVYQDCCRLIDREDFAGARTALEGLLNEESGLMPLHRLEARAERIFCGLMLGEGEEVLAPFQGKDLEKHIKTTKKYFLSRQRLAYAQALLDPNGDPQTAPQIRRDFQRLAARYPWPAEAAGEWRLLDRIDALAHTKGGTPCSP